MHERRTGNPVIAMLPQRARLRKLLISLLLFGGTPARSDPQRTPCTEAQAGQTAGRFTPDPDARFNTDVPVMRSRYPRLAEKMDRAVALLQQALPRLIGAEARPHHTVNTRSLTGSGPVRIGVTTGFFTFYCVPAEGYDPGIAGTIRLGDETRMWIDIAFNSLSWLAHERRQVNGLRLSDGSAIYVSPKELGQLHGSTVYLPEVDASRAEEAIVISTGDRSPWKPVTRAELLDARIRTLQRRLDTLRTLPLMRAPMAQLDAELATLVAAREGLTAEEQATPATVTNPYAPPASLFVTAAGQGAALVALNRNFYQRGRPRDELTMITVDWRWRASDQVHAALIRQFKERFDVAALGALLSPAP